MDPGPEDRRVPPPVPGPADADAGTTACAEDPFAPGAATTAANTAAYRIEGGIVRNIP